MRDQIWRSNVNTVLGLFFVASVSLGAGLMIWNAAFDQNPLANAMYAAVSQELETN